MDKIIRYVLSTEVRIFLPYLDGNGDLGSSDSPPGLSKGHQTAPIFLPDIIHLEELLRAFSKPAQGFSASLTLDSCQAQNRSAIYPAAALKPHQSPAENLSHQNLVAVTDSVHITSAIPGVQSGFYVHTTLFIRSAHFTHFEPPVRRG